VKFLNEFLCTNQTPTGSAVTKVDHVDLLAFVIVCAVGLLAHGPGFMKQSSVNPTSNCHQFDVGLALDCLMKPGPGYSIMSVIGMRSCVM